MAKDSAWNTEDGGEGGGKKGKKAKDGFQGGIEQHSERFL